MTPEEQPTVEAQAIAFLIVPFVLIIWTSLVAGFGALCFSMVRLFWSHLP